MDIGLDNVLKVMTFSIALTGNGIAGGDLCPDPGHVLVMQEYSMTPSPSLLIPIILIL